MALLTAEDLRAELRLTCEDLRRALGGYAEGLQMELRGTVRQVLTQELAATFGQADLTEASRQRLVSVGFQDGEEAMGHQPTSLRAPSKLKAPPHMHPVPPRIDAFADDEEEHEWSKRHFKGYMAEAEMLAMQPQGSGRNSVNLTTFRPFGRRFSLSNMPSLGLSLPQSVEQAVRAVDVLHVLRRPSVVGSMEVPEDHPSFPHSVERSVRAIDVSDASGVASADIDTCDIEDVDFSDDMGRASPSGRAPGKPAMAWRSMTFSQLGVANEGVANEGVAPSEQSTRMPTTSLLSRADSSIVADVAEARAKQEDPDEAAMKLDRKSTWATIIYDAPVKKPASFNSRVSKLVRSSNFDMACGLVIMLNALTIGLQTNFLAQNAGEPLPDIFGSIELVFFIIFSLELAARVFAFRCEFFRRPGLCWNLFDTLIVGVQFMEIVLHNTVEAGQVATNFTLARVLRMLRLVRIIRVLRVLRLINELRTIVLSIGNTLQPLLWTILLLFMLIYLIGVYFCQIVADHRSALLLSDRVVDSEKVARLDRFYADLPRTVLSLYQAICGGVDWSELSEPLVDCIHPAMGVVFCLYIAFALFAMMNVVTGVFVESAMLTAKYDKDCYMVNHVRDLFKKTDLNRTGLITWSEFETQLKSPEMQEYFQAIDVDLSEARGLFRLLDLDDSGTIDAEEFLSGCLRLRGPAKALELSLLMRETRRSAQRAALHSRQIEQLLRYLSDTVSTGLVPTYSQDKHASLDVMPAGFKRFDVEV